MNSNDRNLELIKKAEMLTISGKLQWYRLRKFILSHPENKSLKLKIVSENGYYTHNNETRIDELGSFCAKFESGVIAVFRYPCAKSDQYYTLALQANEDGKVLEITSKCDFQHELKKLIYYIEQSSDNFDSFIEKFINYEG